MQTYTADPNLLWIDVREWVIDTYPWHQSVGVNKLKTLNPEDVGWNHGRVIYQQYMSGGHLQCLIFYCSCSSSTWSLYASIYEGKEFIVYWFIWLYLTLLNLFPGWRYTIRFKDERCWNGYLKYYSSFKSLYSWLHLLPVKRILLHM